MKGIVGNRKFLMLFLLFLLAWLVFLGCGEDEESSSQSFIYWTNSKTGKIHRGSLSYWDVEDLVTRGWIQNKERKPLGIALDVANGKMYWTEWRGKIYRANFDGSNAEELITELPGPNDIALDVVGGKMYWTDTAVSQIGCANLDGSNLDRRLIKFHRDYEFPENIALDVVGGKIYWTGSYSNGSGYIHRANFDGSNAEDVITELPSLGGIALDIVGGKMYWTNWREEKIQRANLDGSNIEDLAQNLYRPNNIVLDVVGGKMYWTDWETNRIMYANLDGSNVRDLLGAIPIGPDLGDIALLIQ